MTHQEKNIGREGSIGALMGLGQVLAIFLFWYGVWWLFQDQINPIFFWAMSFIEK